MPTSRRASLFLALALCLLAYPSEAMAQAPLPSVFNGNDFAGWIVPENNIWWKAGEGVLSVKNGPDQQGSILWTEQEYEDFVVQLEFKMGAGTVDSGIFMRNDHDQIQIGNSGSLKRDMTASPYIPGKGYPVEAEGVATLLKPADWNTLTVVAVGHNYTAWLNGKKVMSYDSETAIKKGPIGLQLHPDREMSIAFRNIRLAGL